MNIALDYDETYTRDPRFWGWFIRMAQEDGHTIKCVTSRYPNQEVYFDVGTKLDVIYCSHKPKRLVCNKEHFYVDVWIDDAPGTIEESY